MPDRGIIPPPSQHHKGQGWLPTTAAHPEVFYKEVHQHQLNPYLSQCQQPNVYNNFRYYAGPPSLHQNPMSTFHDSPLTPISSNVIPSTSSNMIKRTPSFPPATTSGPDIPRMIHTSMSVTPTGYCGYQSPVYSHGNPDHVSHSSSPPYYRRFNPPHPQVAYPPDPASSYHHHFHHPYYLPPHHEGTLPWSMSPTVSVEYISDITSHDVLSGRGGATNSWSGNRAFRKLVKEHQGQYLRAKKRDKPAVASIIVDLIRKRGGRFLRRANEKNDHHHRGGGGGQVLWVDIGDDRAREKTCQALREGAPALRRKNRGIQSNRSTSYEEEDDDDNADDSDDNEDEDGETHKQQKGNFSPSSSSTLRRTRSAGGATTCSSKSGDCKIPRWSEEEAFVGDNQGESASKADHKSGTNSWMAMNMMADGPIYIRPWEKLLVKRDPVEPIDLEQLPTVERDTYLRDFFPPDPCARTSTTKTENASLMTYDNCLVNKNKYTEEFLRSSSSIDSHIPNPFVDDLEEEELFCMHAEHHQGNHNDNNLSETKNGWPSASLTTD